MAKRINAEHDAKTRSKIQTSQLVNRLMKHANGEVKMEQTQVRAAEILLRKTLPDLTATEMKGEMRNFVISAEPLTEEEWVLEYGLPN
jgi:predicted glutamine amidotransferase